MDTIPTEGNDVLFGTDIDETINALGGNDLINGSLGADTIDGGEGFDTVSYAQSDAGIFKSRDTSVFEGGDAEGDILNNVEAIIGSNFDDRLEFKNMNFIIQSFQGLGGSDVFTLSEFQPVAPFAFDVSLGDDDDRLDLRTTLDDEGSSLAGSVFDGGSGIDNLRINRGGSLDFTQVTLTSFERLNFAGNVENYTITFTASQFKSFEFVETSRRGTLEIEIQMGDETKLNLENLSTDGGNASAQDFFIFGDGDAEQITGTSRADVINGGGGSDTLSGGNGSDILNGGNGNDTLRGNSNDDNLSGNSGNDTLLGGDGDDALKGGNNRDTLSGGAGKDVIRGNNGIDTLSGDAGNDRLDGGDGNDVLDGGAGNDRLIGGLGKDILTGGTGVDTFKFKTIEESPNSTASDIITDFEVGIDLIDLRDLGDSFTFIDGAVFSGTGAEVRVKDFDDRALVRVDVDGDGTADFRIVLTDASGLTEGDFLL